jgi:hypothetical protein
MRPALDRAGHRVRRMKPTCLLHTLRPHQRRPFALVLLQHQHQSSHNLHLQYLAKNQSTQRCQSLIRQGSDHPPVLEPHMVLNLPPWWVHWQHPHKVTRDKRKRKETNKKTPTSDRKPNKGKEHDYLKKASLGPLSQGQRLDTSETKLCSWEECKPPNQRSKNHKELPLHTCKLPLNQCNSPWTNACKTPLETRQLQQLSSHRSDWSTPLVRPVCNMWTGPTLWPVRPVHTRAQKWLETTSKPSKCIQQAISSSNFSPLLALHESSQKMQNFQPRDSQIYKIQHRMLHMSKWAS